MAVEPDTYIKPHREIRLFRIIKFGYNFNHRTTYELHIKEAPLGFANSELKNDGIPWYRRYGIKFFPTRY